MRQLALALLAGMALISPLSAKEYQLPEANPAVSVTLPSNWKPEEIDNGVQATSPDGSSYIALETGLSKNLDTLIRDDFKYLKDNGVKIDTGAPERDDFALNGMPTVLLHWKGKDEDGATSVNLFLVGVTNNLVLMVTTWATPEGEKANSEQGRGIVGSVKRICTDCPAPAAPVVSLGSKPSGAPAPAAKGSK